ncbi:MAG: lipid IV(A) 3-deoxy-D-manno-octulosonic acid transferase [Oceanicoccus sp.]|uniref:lipid IV(A) 3-deoxy-D-manno-octulosonic acid transferase n=1 Tax=Oceanicoccus sp. TaxID=2691044 RepID=UPI00261C28DD|nr:lipid IV(A) 3-deoxy-D-manno-octulosonic acid transferase [Oceanicoccus sp.]MDG1773816.1 lipid IV(A) 3-deoxy-D-manno-octulosonic acid transferase [Oceanicoccus sp.]
MARYLYSVFFYLITPLILLRLAYRASKAPAYGQRIAERFGFFIAPKLNNTIWVHSVSVGETIAAAPLIKRLQQQYPDAAIVVTTMTPTGSDRVKALLGDSVFHVYAPYDLPGAIQRFLTRVQPKLLVIMETELWPNTIHYCRQSSIPVVLANARLSEKSAAGYQRLSWLTGPMLNNLSKVVAQNKADADRFLALGLAENKVEVSGSIKFDVVIDKALIAKAEPLKQQWSNHGQRLIIMAASTHQGEDEIILDAFKQVIEKISDALLIIVPRHPERFDQVVNLCEQRFSVARRSNNDTVSAATNVLVGDTMGELLLLCGCADMVFVGGSLINSGGHNMLEPAAWSLPIITGESDFNFAEASRLLQQRSALLMVSDANLLAEKLLLLGQSESLRNEMGANAKAVVEENRGALDRLILEIEKNRHSREGGNPAL